MTCAQVQHWRHIALTYQCNMPADASMLSLSLYTGSATCHAACSICQCLDLQRRSAASTPQAWHAVGTIFQAVILSLKIGQPVEQKPHLSLLFVQQPLHSSKCSSASLSQHTPNKVKQALDCPPKFVPGKQWKFQNNPTSRMIEAFCIQTCCLPSSDGIQAFCMQTRRHSVRGYHRPLKLRASIHKLKASPGLQQAMFDITCSSRAR